MKVKKLLFNWHQVGSSTDNDGAGEDYSVYEVGKNNITDIVENEPHNGMQKWNYMIKTKGGIICRVFNPNYVEYFTD